MFKPERPNFNSAVSAFAGLIPGLWLGGVLPLFTVLLAMPGAAQTQSREENTDRPGHGLSNFNLNVPSPGTFGGPEDVCRETYQRTDQCKAWIFVKAGIQGPNERCWQPSRSAANLRTLTEKSTRRLHV